MRIGLLADIHEEVELLDRSIARLRDEGVDQFLILGDIFETGKRLGETVDRLRDLPSSRGVWGNHDFGLCGEVPAEIRRRVSPEILAYFARLRPWVDIEGCRFQHIEPFLDPNSIEDLWSYGGEGILDPDRAFAAQPHRRFFMGHVHRWELATPGGPVAWNGRTPIRLEPETRYLVVVDAVQQGHCGWYDPGSDWLVPFRIL